jgi:predicted oxidoreductase
MIKAKIKNIEVRLLRDGSFKCKDPHLLDLVRSLSQEYSAGSDYHPDPQLGLMNWLVAQLGGTITHADQIDYSKYPEEEINKKNQQRKKELTTKLDEITVEQIENYNQFISSLKAFEQSADKIIQSVEGNFNFKSQ